MKTLVLKGNYGWGESKPKSWPRASIHIKELVHIIHMPLHPSEGKWPSIKTSGNNCPSGIVALFCLSVGVTNM